MEARFRRLDRFEVGLPVDLLRAAARARGPRFEGHGDGDELGQDTPSSTQ